MVENMQCVENCMGGIMKKTHPKSKFVYRDMYNGLFELDATNPCIGSNDDSRVVPIVVLQIMLCDSHNVLIEFVTAEDF